MARMLMAAAYEESHCNPHCGCDRPKYGRTAQRLREQHAWHQDQWPALYFNPRFEPEDDYDNDPSDCRHGCNGDCTTSGSEHCTFTCHTEEEDA